ncbi:peptide deformylase [Mycoplasma marinum]|uniref:Peptide deformylase n=1 Tax=Mycoplasma marinum TaxID=1937190 RepID=A0A4R0XJA2_9MOLU|nr:peptide deformylase [Mycoplasma marinum]TCG10693.1 peptide deformylase [Mycoplasma marinum]
MNFKITKIPKDNKILRKTLEKVDFPLSEEVKKAADWMINYIDKSQLPGFEDRAGVGIAANQIGVDKRMFYVNIPLGEDKENFKEFLINPEFIGMGTTPSAIEVGEGCLSVQESWPNTDGLVHRTFKVIVKGYSYIQGKEITITKTGYEAIVFQHEMDHINGGLFYDRIEQKKPWKVKEKEVLI